MEHPETSSYPSQPGMSRRKLLGVTGAAAGLLAGTRCLASTGSPCGQRVLQSGDRVELAASPEEIIEKAYQMGYKYEKTHGGCARCTVATLQDALPFVAVDEGLFRGATCLDGGATPVSEQNCGAFTGAGMTMVTHAVAAATRRSRAVQSSPISSYTKCITASRRNMAPCSAGLSARVQKAIARRS